MKELKITAESLEAAKRRCREMPASFHVTPEEIIDVLDTLCVPISEKEIFEAWTSKDKKSIWEQVPPSNKDILREYRRGYYQLLYFPAVTAWELYTPDSLGVNTNLRSYQVTEAQKWADGLIKEQEEPAPLPKPFGPGTRLRLPNGDEVVVFKGTHFNTFNAINITIGELWYSGFWFDTSDDLRHALEKAGAVVI